MQITISFIIFLYYGFLHLEMTRFIYLGMVAFNTIACLIILYFQKFAKPGYEWLRAAAFMSYGFSGLIPAAHLIMLDYFRYHCFYALVLLAVGGLIYLIGTLIYLAKIPERISPGDFDFWFNSHQIFHISVVCASLFHYHSILNIMNLRVNNHINKKDSLEGISNWKKVFKIYLRKRISL